MTDTQRALLRLYAYMALVRGRIEERLGSPRSSTSSAASY